MYFKSRTDLDIVQTPPAPKMGPAGSIVVDPDFGNEIVRASDENSISLGSKPSAFVTAGIGGSADVNTWNTDSTLLYLQDSGSQGAIFSFDPKTLAVERIFPGWRVPGPLVFSRLDPDIAFNFSGTQYLRYDLSQRGDSTPPPPVVMCDFAAVLPGEPTWRSLGGVEAADTVFTAAFSLEGNQGTGFHACAFVMGKGYRVYHTGNGVIEGDFGPCGVIAIPDRFTIHNVKSSKDGESLAIAKTTVLAGDGKGPFFWSIDSLDVSPMSKIAPGGHWTLGYGDFFNQDSNSKAGIPYWSHVRRKLTALDSPWRLSNPTPEDMVKLDDHVSYNGPKNSLLVSVSTSAPRNDASAPYPAAWWNEVLGFDLDGSGRVYRFCHHFSNVEGGNFYSDNAISVGDQMNRFVAFTSNWKSSLLNGRGDTFIVRLR